MYAHVGLRTPFRACLLSPSLRHVFVCPDRDPWSWDICEGRYVFIISEICRHNTSPFLISWLAYLPALKNLSSSARLVAVYSRSRKSATDTADVAKALLQLDNAPDVYCDEDQGVEPLLARADIKAVIIALPITLQPTFIVKCLKAGKHVLSEKPVAKDVQSGLDLIALYEENFKPKSLVWRVAENWEAEPGVRRAAQIIKDGRIGDVRFFRLTSVGYVGLDR